jgi:hypothetical protein
MRLILRIRIRCSAYHFTDGCCITPVDHRYRLRMVLIFIDLRRFNSGRRRIRSNRTRESFRHWIRYPRIPGVRGVGRSEKSRRRWRGHSPATDPDHRAWATGNKEFHRTDPGSTRMPFLRSKETVSASLARAFSSFCRERFQAIIPLARHSAISSRQARPRPIPPQNSFMIHHQSIVVDSINAMDFQNNGIWHQSRCCGRAVGRPDCIFNDSFKDVSTESLRFCDAFYLSPRSILYSSPF